MIERACESVGIDLGTTYSSLAYLDAQLTPRIVPDSSGQTVTPSVIYFGDEDIIVGELALQQAKLDADRIAQFIKVHMGDDWRKEFGKHIHTPESLSAIILGHLVHEAEGQIGPIRRAVITVPAYFTEKRRRATQQAGEIAGLDVLGTLNEPMAATLAYGLHRHDQEQFAVIYDLGGGTFDVTVVRICPNEIQELATNGNRQLGGRDWDQCLIDFVAEDFRKTHGADPRTLAQAAQDLQLECESAKRRLSKLPGTAIRLHAFGHDHITDVTRQQFEILTAPLLQSTKLTLEMALEDAGLSWSAVSRVVLVGGSTHMPAVRAMLKETCGFPPDTGVNPVTAVALGAAIYAHVLETGQSFKAIHQVTIASAEPTTMPSDDLLEADTPIHDLVPETESAARPPETVPQLSTTRQAFAPEPANDPDTGPGKSEPRIKSEVISSPDTKNAIGKPEPRPPARGDVLGCPSTIPNVLFVTAHGVGLKVRSGQGWKNSVLIAKNTPVPVKTTKRYVTAERIGPRNHLKIEITQGDTSQVELAEILGTGRIDGFPPSEPAGQPVDVTFEFDAQGRLHVGAVHVSTGRKMRWSLEIPGGLRAEEVIEHREFMKKNGLFRIYSPDPALQGLDDDDDELSQHFF